ncbi:MAG: DNA polymerase III subunit delta' [Pseudoxanthomonas sp.]
MSHAFSPWQQRAFDHAISALETGRMGHGLMVCGPTGLGKRAVVEAMAQYVLCGGPPVPGDRNLQLLGAGTHPDMHRVSFIPTRDGSKLRTEIVIDQIRELSQKLSLTPQYGRAVVAIVDPADAVNRSAYNALLKTLEEPAPGRYLWLVATDAMRLPATIRSRCQKLEFRLPAPDEALQWLQVQGHDAAVATQALDAARGHPGLADEWLRHDGMALRQDVAKDLERVRRGDASAVETAQRWSSDTHADLRLRHAADLALAQASSTGLTDPARLNKLARWFDAANRTRDLLRTTVRADLAMVELLLAWRESNSGPSAHGDRR